MEDHGIAWMIAGGVRAQSAEDRRQQLHRVAIAESRPATDDILVSLRRKIRALRLAAITEGRSPSADSTACIADCSPA